MNTKDFSEKVLATIKKEHIKPKSRWEFLLKDYFLWTLFIVSVFVGSISVSVLTFVIKNEDRLFSVGPENPIKSFLFAVPYFWLLLLLLFLFLAYLNFRFTKTGYRYNIFKIFVLSIVTSIIFGSVFYYFGISERVEHATYYRFPLYKNMMDHRGEMIFSPEEGHLGGIVVEKEGSDIEVASFDGRIWTVNIEKVDRELRDILEINSRVRFVGRITSEDYFEAIDMIPWSKPPKPGRRELNYLDERNPQEMRIIK